MLVAALALVLAGSPAAPAAPAARPADAEAARRAHERYKAALLSKDGPAAARAVDRETVAYYGRMVALALDGPAAEVKKLSVIDKLMVVRLRHELGLEALRGLDGPRLLGLAVEKGWIDPSSVQHARLGEIRVDGDEATGDLVVAGKTAPSFYAWRFRREGGAWKVSLLPLMRLALPAVNDAVKQAGVAEDTWVLGVVEQVSGRPVPPSVWEPLRRR